MTMMSFKKRKNFLKKTQDKIESRLDRVRNARVILVLIFVASLIYLTANPGLRLEVVAVAVFLTCFVPLVFMSRRLDNFQRKLQSLKRFYEREEIRQTGKILTLETRKNFGGDRNAWPALARDLQLWGPASIFSYLDETVTVEGADQLSHALVHPILRREDILQKQKQVQALAQSSGRLRRIVAEGRKLEKTPATQDIVKYSQSPLISSSILKMMFVLMAFWVVLVGFSVVSVMTGGSFALLPWAWVLFILCSLSLTQFSSQAFHVALHLSHLLDQCRELIREFENLAAASHLKIFWPALGQKSLSRELGKLERWATYLSIEAHPIIYLLLNAISPWSLFFGYLLERARRTLSSSSTRAFSEMHEMEVALCLALQHRYRTQTWPQFSEQFQFEAKAVFHPLIDRQHVIANDFQFASPKKLCLLTGSNMSGKSTFLRSLGLNQVLALMGGPVFAQSWVSVAAPVETCIQVSDSLNEGFSYFYSEVLRLKEILHCCQGRRSFYLIDEIFKGTNNRERLIGSEAILKALAKTESFGFVTTHDLELASLEGKDPQICNFHFRDEVKAGSMSFPYRLFDGPCSTTNALKIMVQEGLPVPV